MRVLLITPTGRSGGADRCARELFHGLRSIGHTTTMCVADRQSSDPDGVRGLRMPGEKYLRALEVISRRPIDWRHIGSLRVLGRMHEGDFDVVHLHNLHTGWLSLGAIRRLCERLPVVWTLHDEWAVTPGIAYDLSRVYSEHEIRSRFDARYVLSPNHARARRIQASVKKHMPRPAQIVSPSQYIYDLVGRCPWFGSSGRALIRYGVTMLAEEAARAEQGAARKRFQIDQRASVILLIAARLDSPYKGIGYAVDAINALPGEPVVLAAGDGADAIAARLNKRCVQSGFLRSQADLALAYRAANVTLIPSVAENLPYVGLESLSCATPIVCFSVGGMPDIVGNDERGLLCPPFDVGRMSAALSSLLSDASLAARLGASGRAWIESNCGFDAYLQRHVTLYSDTIGAFRRSRTS